MYEIKENRRELFDGTEITTYTRDVVSANILQKTDHASRQDLTRDFWKE